MIIRIKDEGMGMGEETLGKLFSLDKGPSVKGTDKETGSGLGLIIAQEFVMLNEGVIYAESEPEKGSTFYLEFQAWQEVSLEDCAKGQQTTV